MRVFIEEQYRQKYPRLQIASSLPSILPALGAHTSKKLYINTAKLLINMYVVIDHLFAGHVFHLRYLQQHKLKLADLYKKNLRILASYKIHIFIIMYCPTSRQSGTQKKEIVHKLRCIVKKCKYIEFSRYYFVYYLAQLIVGSL